MMDPPSGRSMVPKCDSNRIVEVPISISGARKEGEIVIDWSTSHGGIHGNRLTFKSPSREMFNLRFRIEPNDVGLEFPNNPLAAFWVAPDEAPNEAAYVRDFEPVSVSEDRRELLVLNINRSPANYCFAINFNSHSGPLRLISGAQ